MQQLERIVYIVNKLPVIVYSKQPSIMQAVQVPEQKAGKASSEHPMCTLACVCHALSASDLRCIAPHPVRVTHVVIAEFFSQAAKIQHMAKTHARHALCFSPIFPYMLLYCYLLQRIEFR